ncbi:zf-HC2 domain-containing protein [Ramlibacter rhizophilus]|uniref:Zf-HC2 domain-containing protein n=1 Tax=Ramlibacter rhizophilus TaxID=1781167 RepID=A0A4Z0BPG9_9BURK|nr:zf-HC2 domain-containing protein [Ramlibacter rhizophilus]TFY99868.1 zf-HC2 domain-containing protein [Ramlibacter rhizophilus]
MSAATEHLSLSLLLQDWLGETDSATREAIDAHLMACDDCGALFDDMLVLQQGVRTALRDGRLHMAASARLVDRLVEQGLRVREYHVPAGGSVNCTLAPQDEVLVSRLQAPLAGVEGLDLVEESSLAPGERLLAQDLPFDPRAGELVYLVQASLLRPQPAHTVQLTLLAREEGGSREIGRYVFHHSPWPG